MKTYRVTFERIGRNHSVAPMVAKVEDADQLADYIHRHARPHLRSRDYDVKLEIAGDGTGHGFIACGMHSGGDFTITSEA